MDRLDETRIVVKGSEARVRWGYHPAATLEGWTFSGSLTAGGSFAGRLTNEHAFRLSQAPLTLTCVIDDGGTAAILRAAPWLRGAPWLQEHTNKGRTDLRWPVRALVRDGGSVRIDVGPCERST